MNVISLVHRIRVVIRQIIYLDFASSLHFENFSLEQPKHQRRIMELYVVAFIVLSLSLPCFPQGMCLDTEEGICIYLSSTKLANS
jgi:hypothetical protein